MNSKDDTYFEAYADLEVHERMLRDVQRNEAYRKAIESNREYFQNKTVLDVGAGTGILSILSAKVGASKVYAVEACKIATIAKAEVRENNVEDIVEVIEKRIEDVQLPTKVDIIISEWMGFYLLHEGMLDSVIFARNKFLKDDGVLFPDTCQLFVAPCSLPSLYSDWTDVSGLSMRTFASSLRELYRSKPKISVLPAECLLSEGVCVHKIELKYVTTEELDDITCELFTTSGRDGSYEGICIWFTVSFPSINERRSEELILSTSPAVPKTHWKQTLLIMAESIEVFKQCPIFGTLSLRRSKINSRFYDIEFEVLDPDDVDHPIPCDCDNSRCKIIKALSEQYDERDEEMNDVD